MPDTVWTMEVKAAMGITYRASSMAFFSASRPTLFRRFSDACGERLRRPAMMP